MDALCVSIERSNGNTDRFSRYVVYKCIRFSSSRTLAVVCYCLLLSVVVCCCLLLSVVCCCLLSVVLCCCMLLTSKSELRRSRHFSIEVQLRFRQDLAALKVVLEQCTFTAPFRFYCRLD